MKAFIFLFLVGCGQTSLPADAGPPPDSATPPGVICLFDMRCEKCNALGVCP